MDITILLQAVTKRLEKQFNTPVTFTQKVINQEAGVVEFHVFLHGYDVSKFITLEDLNNLYQPEVEDIRKINAISDYLIAEFIHAISKVREDEVLAEIVTNLEYLNNHRVVTEHTSDHNKVAKVSFILLEKDAGELKISLQKSQVIREYENRFDSENAPDILFDLGCIFTQFKEHGFTAALDKVRSLNRGIFIAQPKAGASFAEAYLQNIIDTYNNF